VRLVRVTVLDREIRQALVGIGMRHGEQPLEARDPLKPLRPVANRLDAPSTHLSVGQPDEMSDVDRCGCVHSGPNAVDTLGATSPIGVGLDIGGIGQLGHRGSIRSDDEEVVLTGRIRNHGGEEPFAVR
jgi:hypothetical protein